jgi:hypothetical protein
MDGIRKFMVKKSIMKTLESREGSLNTSRQGSCGLSKPEKPKPLHIDLRDDSKKRLSKPIRDTLKTTKHSIVVKP